MKKMYNKITYLAE